MTQELKAKREHRSKGPELLAHFGAVLADRLNKEGLAERKASEVALNVMDFMKVEFGGQNIYFPMGFYQSQDEKADEIFKKFMEGASVPELASEYGHSIQWIYRLIANVRAQRKAAREEERRAEQAKAKQRWKREGGIGDDL